MNRIMVNADKIGKLLSRGVEEVIDFNNLKNKLESGRRLRIKLGIDPTSLNLHLGRSVPLLKLRDFQELGHQVVIIIGDFTGLIGDTSDKGSERPMLPEKVVKANAKTYIRQMAKIIDIKQAEVHYNSRWLKKLDYAEINRQADQFSLNEFISRENIDTRMKNGRRVSLREVLYPLMQGYDSVQIKADVEVGGTDQRFNLLAGRDMQKFYGQSPQDILTGPLVAGLDGRKMSSSFGNTINFLDAPNDIFGKIMSMKDDSIIEYFILFTRVDALIIDKYKNDLKSGINPRDVKAELASEIVRMYHSDKAAQTAKDYFTKVFSQREIPSERQKFHPEHYDIVSVLSESGLAVSRSDARRIVEQGGVKVDGQIVKNIDFTVNPGSVLQKGKIRFLDII